MNNFYPIPVVSLLKIVYRNGGIPAKNLLHLPPWLLKTIIFEPLRWYEFATKVSAVNKHTIEKHPVFILGYYRSGTTYLQQLFMQDNRFGFTSIYQTVFPEIMLTCEKWMTPLLEFFSKIFRHHNHIHRIPFTWYGAGEEDIAFVSGLHPRGAQWGYFFPGKMMEYFEKYVLFENIEPGEFAEWENYYSFFLKKLSLANDGKQLVLKSPPNTARIKHLLRLFPNAKFVYLKRNPYEVYSSKKRVWKVIRENFSLGSSKSVDDDQIVLETYSRMMKKYLEERVLIPEGNLVEIEYGDLLKNPLVTTRHIYQSLQLVDFNKCEDKLEAYTHLQKKYEVLHHKLSEDEIRKVSNRLGSLIREMGYGVL